MPEVTLPHVDAHISYLNHKVDRIGTLDIRIPSLSREADGYILKGLSFDSILDFIKIGRVIISSGAMLYVPSVQADLDEKIIYLDTHDDLILRISEDENRDVIVSRYEEPAVGGSVQEDTPGGKS